MSNFGLATSLRQLTNSCLLDHFGSEACVDVNEGGGSLSSFNTFLLLPSNTLIFSLLSSYCE